MPFQPLSHHKYRPLSPAGLFFLAGLLLSGCAAPITAAGSNGADSGVNTRTGFYFDTVISVTVYDELPADRITEALDACDALAARYDRSLKPGLSPAALDSEARALFDEAMLWSDRTDGAFSPTLGTLTGLWNFNGNPPGPVPSDSAVGEALRHLSAEDPACLTDLGGIAKGYIADRMKETLKEAGVTSAVINLGGNVLLLGEKPDGSPFRVGIRDPHNPSGGDLLCTLEAADISVVTSGIYERCFEEDGVLYHHVLDPATGYPADSDLSAVTVITPDSASGDALSTACLVLGYDRARTLIDATENAEALFVFPDNTAKKTAGFP